MFQLRPLPLITTAAAATMLAALSSCAKEAEEPSRVPTEARLSFPIAGDAQLALRFVHQDEIQRCMVNPLKKAKPDRDPANYVVLGDMHITFDDGSEEGAVLFLPWGHYKSNGKYMIADFGPLQQYVLNAIGRAKDHVARE